MSPWMHWVWIPPRDAFASISDDRADAFFNQAQVYPSRLPVVHNPFDPQLFNRRYDLPEENDIAVIQCCTL